MTLGKMTLVTLLLLKIQDQTSTLHCKKVNATSGNVELGMDTKLLPQLEFEHFSSSVFADFFRYLFIRSGLLI